MEFENEEGTGLGPTLEFYALVAAELQRRDLCMWLCDDQPLLSPEDAAPGDRPPDYYVLRPSGLFPAPLPQVRPAAPRREWRALGERGGWDGRCLTCQVFRMLFCSVHTISNFVGHLYGEASPF